MIIEATLNILLAISLLLYAIFFHELGHAYYIKEQLGKKIKFNKSFKDFGIEFNPSGITKGEHINIYSAGILGGIIPFIMLMPLFTLPLVFGATVLLYVIGCTHDIKGMFITYFKREEIKC